MKIIEKRKKKISLSKKIGLIILLPLVAGITVYLGLGIYIFIDMSSYNQDLEKYYWYDSPDLMYTGNRSFDGYYQNANWTDLEYKANIYENWTDSYNIAEEGWDCATTLAEINFKEGMTSPFSNNSQYLIDLDDFMNNSTSKFRNKTDVNPIGGYGDSPMWTGNYMASLAFHYFIACEEGNATEANEILRKIKRPTDGLHILTHVSGLRGNLARFAIKDTPENRIRFSGFFYKIVDGQVVEREFGREDNKYPGQGEYEGWWYQMRTSRDQHIGLFFGYGITYKLLSKTSAPSGVNTTLRDSILTTIGNDGSDVLDLLIGANWHIINGEIAPGDGQGFDEASLHPRIPWTSGGDVQLAFLSFGKMVNPDKYTYYYNKIINRFLATSYHFAAEQSGAYYGNNLGFESMFLGYFLEQDSLVRESIRSHFNKDFFEYIQYHRNSFFNLGWLYINDYDLNDDILLDKRLTYRLDDIVDNLYRFSQMRFPSRHWYIPGPADGENLVHPTARMYSEIFAEDSDHILNTLYGWIFSEFSDTSEKSMMALGTDETGSTDFTWQRNPFSLGGTHPWDPTYKGSRQHAGVDYTLPY
jgi:hypothetical protein